MKLGTTTSRDRLWPVLSVAVLVFAALLGAWSLHAATRTAETMEQALIEILRKDARDLANKICARVEQGILRVADRRINQPPQRARWDKGHLTVPDDSANDPPWIRSWMVLDAAGKLRNPSLPLCYLVTEKTPGSEAETLPPAWNDAVRQESLGNLKAALESFEAVSEAASDQPARQWQARAAVIATTVKLNKLEAAKRLFDQQFWDIGQVARPLNPTVVQMRVFQADLYRKQGFIEPSARALLELARAIVDTSREFCADEFEEDWVFSRLKQAIDAGGDSPAAAEQRRQYRELLMMRDRRRKELRFYSAEGIPSLEIIQKKGAKNNSIGYVAPGGETVAVRAFSTANSTQPDRLLVCELDMQTIIRQIVDPLRHENMARPDDLTVRYVFDQTEPFARLPEPLSDLTLQMTESAEAHIGQLARRQKYLVASCVASLAVALVGGLLLLIRNLRREMELTRLKSEFVANVSHELKTPLALIRMFGETLRDRRTKNEEKAHEYHGIIVRESERLTRLINNILDFSKIEAGKKQYNFSMTNLAPIVNQTVESYEHALKRQGFQTDLDVPDDLPPTLADGEAISQAVLNLINNAVKYSPDTKKLTVRAWAENGELCVAVADQGIGIGPEDQERIFQEFYRVASDDVLGQRGTGLGLTLVRHIVAAHGGRIDLKSQLGHGSTFTLRLPVRASLSGDKKNSSPDNF